MLILEIQWNIDIYIWNVEQIYFCTNIKRIISNMHRFFSQVTMLDFKSIEVILVHLVSLKSLQMRHLFTYKKVQIRVAKS